MFFYHHITLKSVLDFGRRRALSVIGKVALQDIEQPQMRKHVHDAFNQLELLVRLFFSSSYSGYYQRTRMNVLPLFVYGLISLLCNFSLAYNSIRGKLHDSVTDPGTKCVTVRGYFSKEEKDPNNEPVLTRGAYWGAFHVLIDGQVKYNKFAHRSLASKLEKSTGKGI